MTAKLEKDLDILEAMSAEMADYLKSDTLFYPMTGANLPRLTLGGYLMRQHRLAALQDLLTPTQQARLERAMAQFQAVVADRVVRLEQRAQEELSARLNQWEAYLDDLDENLESAAAYYPTAVEARAMMEALLNYLEQPPYRISGNIRQALLALDDRLLKRWADGAFIWSEAWQKAYPRHDNYWWLYGRPYEPGETANLGSYQVGVE